MTNRGDTVLDIAAHSLGCFDIGVDRLVASLLVEVVHQCQQTGCFTRLAGGMEDKIFPLGN